MPIRPRALVARLAAFAVLLALPGCLQETARSARTLAIWAAPGGIEERAFLRLRDRFQVEHPGVKVDVLGPVADDKVVRGIIAGCPPDIAYMYGTDTVGALAANHAILQLDDKFRKAGLRNDQFLPGTIEQSSYLGHIYAMPVTRDSRGLYWNRTVLREAGLDPNHPPTTLEEMMRMSKRITRISASGKIDRLGFLPPVPDDYAALIFLLGGNLYDDKAQFITLDAPENVRALEWIVKMYDSEGGYAAVNAFRSGFGRDDSTQNPLAMGLVGMQITGEWVAMYLEKYTPEADYGIARLPYPEARPDLANMAYQDGDCMVIPAGAKNPDLAWEFLRWMQEPRQQEEYAAAMNNLPSIRSLRNSPVLTTGTRCRQTLGFILKNIASESKYPRFSPTLPVKRLYMDELSHAVEAAALKQRTPQDALHEAQYRVARELRRYLR